MQSKKNAGSQMGEFDFRIKLDGGVWVESYFYAFALYQNGIPNQEASSSMEGTTNN